MIYCYSVFDEEGNALETVERNFPMDSVPRQITLDDGRIASRDLRAEGKGTKNTAWSRPLLSNSAGVPVRQIEQARQVDRELGAPEVEYRPNRHGTADVAFTGRRQRQQWLRAHQMIDRDGGYGDG